MSWYDEALTTRIVEVYEGTGEIRNAADLSNPLKSCTKPIFGELNGIKHNVSTMSLFGQKSLIVVAHSKMLKQPYLHGITQHTVRQLYDYLMSLNLFNIEFSDFLSCSIFDIDIKSDFEMSAAKFKAILLEKKAAVKGSKPFRNEDGTMQGLQYGIRGSKSLREPFVKYYSKGIELRTNSNVFRNNFMPSWFNDDLRRVEVTVKNSRAVKSLIDKGLLPENTKTLKDWLTLDQETLLSIITHLIQRWEDPFSFVKKRVVDKTKKITASDFVLMKMYEALKKENYTIDQVANMMSTYPSAPETLSSQKSRFKTKLKRFDDILNNTTETLKRLGVYSYL